MFPGDKVGVNSQGSRTLRRYQGFLVPGILGSSLILQRHVYMRECVQTSGFSGYKAGQTTDFTTVITLRNINKHGEHRSWLKSHRLYFQKEMAKGGEGAEIQRHSSNTARTITSAIQKPDQNASPPARPHRQRFTVSQK